MFLWVQFRLLITINHVHFDLGSLLQGQNQGQRTGNALAPNVTVRLRRKWSQTIPRPKSSRTTIFKSVQLDLQGQSQGQTTGNASSA